MTDFFQIYVEQKNEIHGLKQLVRELLNSHKDGFHGCCWCGVGVGGVHEQNCVTRRALRMITAHDEQDTP